ncbi:MAG TPA: GNAT family N-acetyltransferase [Candidatus Krumholzibacteria bacterium]|nr:GNAT family N-acetyltransferase [Candidatus Krumholzibacteria bacterium]
MSSRVQRLTERDIPGVVDVLSDAFAGYPVMAHMLGPGHGPESDHLRRFVHFAAMARVYRREFLFGVSDGGVLQAAALLSRPSRSESPPPLDALREDLWNVLGPEARARYESYGVAIAPFLDLPPHLHLNMIGVRHAAHGRGLARALLEHVQVVSYDDADSCGVSLTTETEKNVPLYRHFGYRLIGKTEIVPGLTCWGFFRPNAHV